jgi:hypothetical protein
MRSLNSYVYILRLHSLGLVALIKLVDVFAVPLAASHRIRAILETACPSKALWVNSSIRICVHTTALILVPMLVWVDVSIERE